MTGRDPRSGRPHRRLGSGFGGGLLLAILALAAPPSARAAAATAAGSPQANADVSTLDRRALDRLIDAAAERFGVPADWIRAVMRQESGFDPRATSRVGAMGLMQVMPETWAELRIRYGLGTDPYEPRDNVLAGAAYLREMYDRFGAEGMLAAYNVGPGRYLQHRDQGRPLPPETRDYVRRIGSLDGPAPAPSRPLPAPATVADPASAPLFPADLPASPAGRSTLFVALATDRRRATAGPE